MPILHLCFRNPPTESSTMHEYRRLEKDSPLDLSRAQFPFKLYSMLQLTDVTGTGGSSNVTWLSHGRAFRILDEREFMRVNVPMYFKQTKIRSFYRQLNLWGYKRLMDGVDAGAWYNEFFLKGNPQEMHKMLRIKIKGKSGKISHLRDLSYLKEPDFYSMPSLPSVINTAGKGVMGRRVSVESISNEPSSEEFQFSGNRSPNPEEFRFAMPATSLSRCASSLPLFCSSLSQTWNENDVPSAIPMDHIRQDTLINSFNQSSSGMNHQVTPEPRSCAIFPRLTAGFEPLPFHGTASSTIFPLLPFHDTASSAICPSDYRIKSTPFKNEIPMDEFASYIDTVIQML